MRRPTRRALLALVLAAVLALLWLVLRPLEADPVPAPESADRSRPSPAQVETATAGAPPVARSEPSSETPETTVVDDPPLADEFAPPSWRIRVVGPDGRPVVGGVAHLTSSKGSLCNIEIHDFEGAEFEVPASSADWTLWVEVSDVHSPDGKRLGGGMVVSPLGPDGGEREVRLERGLAIAGKTIDEDGAPVAGVRIRSQRKERSPVMHSFVEARATSGPDGRFRLEGLRPGDQALDLDVPAGYQRVPQMTAVAGDESLEITLGPGDRASITVLDWQGRPVPRVRVSLRRELPPEGGATRSWSLSTRTDESGRATIRGLDPAASYRISVHETLWGPDRHPLVDRPWTPGDDTIRLPRRYSLAGSVQFEDGRPAPGCRILAEASDGSAHHGRTFDGGRFRLDGLPEGEVKLWASPALIPRENRPPPLLAVAGDMEVGLTVPNGIGLEVTVLGWPGPRKAIVSLITFDPNRLVRIEHLSSEGRVRFVGVEPTKRCVIWLAPTADGRYARYEGLPPAGGRLTLSLRKGGIVRGVVRLPSGAAPRSLVVTVYGPGTGIRATGDASGAYEAIGVPPGSWKMFAAGKDEKGALRQARREGIAPDTPVDLVLE